ncbi:hypothetical protein Syun_022215 [Stephania yunnanensis]|uniref:PB1 domain-containing protein n=1 Tax=Stephania yunnanensis TaxID=152371 RepID=A0AAP0NQD2_9MAGN
MEKKPSSGGRGRSAKFFRTCFLCCNFFGKVEDSEAQKEEIGPAAEASAELRLLCSYGGRLAPLDSFNYSQIYRGGENRFIAVDRRCSAADLLRRLSTDFLGGRSFTLKYHISGPGLNAFITVVTDEDLRFMIEEYDRLTTSAHPLRPPPPTVGPPRPPLPTVGPPRPPLPLPPLPAAWRYLRVFLCPASPETGVLSRAVSPSVPRSSEEEDEFSEDDSDYDG